MSTDFNLGGYLGVPNGSASYAAILDEFEAALGAAPTYAYEAIDYSKPISTWVSQAQSAAGLLLASPGGAAQTPVFSLPLKSTSDTTTTTLQAFTQIASGADDAVWKGIVQAYLNDGYTTLYLRPGWELNGNFMPWAITTEAEAQAYVAAFQHISDVVKSVAGIDVKMIWNPVDVTQSTVPTVDTYPGDNYVDVVATDIYSTLYPESLYDWSTGQFDTSIQQWWSNPVNLEHYWDYPDSTKYRPLGTGRGWGLADALQFAAAHGKPFAIPETGAGDNGTSTGPVDNAVFPEYLAQRLLAAGAPSVDFVTLWARLGSGLAFYDGNHPKEAAAWADFVKKMMQGDAGPTASTANIIVGHDTTTNLLAGLQALITPGQPGDAETISNVSAALGRLSIGNNGAINYTDGSAGTDSVTYTVTDQLGDTITVTTNIVVDGGPTINAAATKVGHGQTVTVASLSSSLVTVGLRGDVETFSNVSAVNGTVSVAGDGTISYTAPASGTDTLTYTVTDQYGDSVTGSSTIAVDPGPTIATFNGGVNPGAVLLLGGKIGTLITPGLTGDKESLTAVSALTGTATLVNGGITYTAPASGQDTITYTVTDQLGDTAIGTYNLTVSPANVVGTVKHYNGPTDPSWGSGDSGVTVTLLDGSGAVVATTVSGGGGYFAFGNLLAGTYQLLYTPPAGQQIYPMSTVIDPTTGLSAQFTLVANQTLSVAIAPMVPAAAFTGQVVEAGAGDAGVTVSLLSSTGAPIATTVTDSNGDFAFNKLAAGSYKISYSTPSGTALQAGGPADIITGLTALYTLAAGQLIALPDETLAPDGEIAGSVVYAGAPQAGVAVTLFDTSGNMIDTDTTDASGLFSFLELAAGNYQVQYTAPNGEALQSGSVADTTSSLSPVIALAAGQTFTLAAESLVSVGAIITGTVTASGAADPGVTVALLNGSGNTVASTTTDGSGVYSFAGLAPGSYSVDITPPAGQVLPTGGAANATTGVISNITATTGQTAVAATEDLLLTPAVVQGSIHYFGSGNPSWGSGQYGVTVSLLDASGNVVGSMVTGGTGWFAFRNLVAGTYQLQYATPAGEVVKAAVSSFTVTPGQNLWLPIAGVISSSNSFTLTGTGSVAGRGDGDYTVTGNAVSSSLFLGNGNSTITLTGRADHVTTGDGNETITLAGTKNVVTIGSGTSTVNAGNGGATVHADGGNVTITAGGVNNLFDSGAGTNHFVADGSAGNVFMLNGASQGLTTIDGFNTGTTDVLDLSRTLAGVDILADMSNVPNYITAAVSGGNTVLYSDVNVDGTSAAATAIAVLTGVNTSVSALLTGHHLSMA